jgi:hypothetical protein
VADLAKKFAFGIEFQQLRRARSVGWACRIATRENEDVTLRIYGDARNLAEIQIGRQVQEIRHRVVWDLRNRRRLRAKLTRGKEQDKQGSSDHGDLSNGLVRPSRYLPTIEPVYGDPGCNVIEKTAVNQFARAKI